MLSLFTTLHDFRISSRMCECVFLNDKFQCEIDQKSSKGVKESWLNRKQQHCHVRNRNTHMENYPIADYINMFW